MISYILVGTQEEILKEQFTTAKKFNLQEKKQELLDKGYELVEDMISPALLAGEGEDHYLFVREKESIVFPTASHKYGETVPFSKKLSWPKGVSEKDLIRRVKRTILFQNQSGQDVASAVVQEVRIGRSAIVNHAQGTVSYLDWQPLSHSQGFESVVVPVIDGYEADKQSVPATEQVDFSKENQILVVQYRGIKCQIHVRIVDVESGQELLSDTYSGRTGEEIDYPVIKLLQEYAVLGYEIVSNDFSKGNRFTSGKEQVFTIQVKPRIIVFDSVEQLPQVGTKIYPEIKNSPVWPKGLEKTEIERKIVRKIVFKHEDGSIAQKSFVQSVVFNRSVVYHLVSGELLYSPWESERQTMPAFPAPEIEGYRGKPSYIPEWSGVTSSSKDRSEIIVYTRTIQKAEVHFVDQSQNILLYRTELIGRSGEELAFKPDTKLQELYQNGYELVKTDFPESGHFGYQSEQRHVYTFTMRQKIVTVRHTSPKEAGTYVEKSGRGAKWPVGVSESDLNRSVTRTIRYLAEDGREVKPAEKDSVLFVREAKVNLVSGQITYSDWHAAKKILPEIAVEQVEGYYSHQTVVPAVTHIEPSSFDIEHVVRYVAVKKPYWIKVYKEGSAIILAERMTFSKDEQDLATEVDGVLIPIYEKGYELAKNYSLEIDSDNQISIQVRPIVKVITVETAKKANASIEGFKRLSWPKGVEVNNLQKVVVRKIQFCNDAGVEISPAIEQEIVLTRKANVSLPTGRVSYGEWTGQTDVFPEVEVPTVTGYKPQIEVVGEQQINSGSTSQVITVVYQHNPQQINVYYHNSSDSSQVFVDEIVGRVGERIHYLPQKRLVAGGFIGYDIVESKCPEYLTVTRESQEFHIYVKERTAIVTWEEPKEAYSVLELAEGEIFVWPRGLDKASLSYKVMRHIDYVFENQKPASESITQECQVYREAIVNLVTSEVVYGPWKSDKKYFEAVKSPEIQGYEVDKAQVSSLKVRLDGAAQRIHHVITYYEVPYRFNVTVEDVHSNKVLEKAQFVVRAGEKLGYSLENLIDHYVNQGYELVETIVPEQFTLENSNDNLVEIHLRPQFVTVQLEDIKNNFSSIAEEEDVQKLKTIPGLSLFDVSYQLKRTIQYEFTDGKEAAPRSENYVNFERVAKVNMVTGTVQYGDWYSYYPIFDEVMSPIIDGFQASQEIIPSLANVSVNMGDSFERVRYTPRIQEVVVNVINKATGDVLYTETIQGSSNPKNAFTSEEVLGQYIHNSLQKGKPALIEEPVQESGLHSDPNATIYEKLERIENSPKPEEIARKHETESLLKRVKRKVIALLEDND
ncbi:TPA: hypothetical protein ACGOVU_001774 [Streptococcus suis]|nr:hypothetical protein [Streptococcus suis]MBY5038164.1 hypothetical protein [Streptococcus suis]MDW8758440.1 hypothetical protein [Streptococcus suis]NQN54360.1 hypothetical protein [Streptococcus suis]NRG98045.1 hypothetical protein [Streptococcus suis]